MCRSFFGYEIFMPDLICFYTFANKTCFAFVLSQIKKAALRAAAKVTRKRFTTEKDYS